MKTYEEFTGQYGDLIRSIVLEKKLFEIEMCKDSEDQDEINEDFFFRYGKNELSSRAFEILTK